MLFSMLHTLSKTLKDLEAKNLARKLELMKHYEYNELNFMGSSEASEVINLIFLIGDLIQFCEKKIENELIFTFK